MCVIYHCVCDLSRQLCTGTQKHVLKILTRLDKSHDKLRRTTRSFFEWEWLNKDECSEEGKKIKWKTDSGTQQTLKRKKDGFGRKKSYK